MLKAGAAYVPFDPELPAARLDYMLADSGPRVLLSQGGHHQTLSLPPGKTVLCEVRAGEKGPGGEGIRARFRVANLLVAGRCASMTHEGQAAARASGGCFVMGQAAGTAAALAMVTAIMAALS